MLIVLPVGKLIVLENKVVMTHYLVFIMRENNCYCVWSKNGCRLSTDHPFLFNRTICWNYYSSVHCSFYCGHQDLLLNSTVVSVRLILLYIGALQMQAAEIWHVTRNLYVVELSFVTKPVWPQRVVISGWFYRFWNGRIVAFIKQSTRQVYNQTFLIMSG